MSVKGFNNSLETISIVWNESSLQPIELSIGDEYRFVIETIPINIQELLNVTKDRNKAIEILEFKIKQLFKEFELNHKVVKKLSEIIYELMYYEVRNLVINEGLGEEFTQFLTNYIIYVISKIIKSM